MTVVELKAKLEAHALWLNGDSKGIRADLHGANLYGADLCRADLRWADLREAGLYEADLRWADLRWADLREANLCEADLRWANLYGADLCWADLRWADLREANLRWANLHWANLCGADLREANLREANLYGMKQSQAPIQLCNVDGYPVLITDFHIVVGCKPRPITKCYRLSAKVLNEIHPGAAKWWTANKDWLLPLARKHHNARDKSLKQ